MEDIINTLNEETLEEVAGGAKASKKHVQIVNCTHCTTARSTPFDEGDDNRIGYAYLGDCYLFYGWSGDWAKIQFGDKVAYVRKARVKVIAG